MKAAVAAWALAKFLPRTSFYHRIVLLSTVHGSPAIAVASTSPIQLGQSGTARSMLRPAGKADFAGHTVDVITQGEFIDPGSAIRIVAVNGMRVVVEKA